MSLSNNITILFVDDDERLCRLVKRYLKSHEYNFVAAHNADDAHKRISENNITLALLDIMLPDRDGLTLAQEIRTQSDIPIIFLTAKADIDDKVNGLEAGADDYITKPFEEKELIARIQSVLRRSQLVSTKQTNRVKAVFAGWTIDYLKQSLTSPEGDIIDITSSEYQILAELVNHEKNMITREDILKILSGREWSPLDRSADMAISKLRKKIEPNTKKPEVIKTIRNKGYQLTTAVHFFEE